MTVIESMVKIYANLIKNGRRTIESLPAIYQEPVKQYLSQN